MTLGLQSEIKNSKQMQNGLDRLTERLTLQIERLPIAYIFMDADFRILEWNPAAQRIFGYAKEEVVGRPCAEFIHPWPLNERLEKICRQIEAGDLQSHWINENRTKDGRIITCDWLNTPLIDSAGEFTGIISLAQDVSWRNQFESLLDENRRCFQAIFENILDPILIFSDLGRFLGGNPAACELLGCSREAISCLSLWDVTPAENQASIPGLLGRFFSAGSQIGEYIFLSKNGTRPEVEYRWAANILPGLHMAILREISGRKSAELTRNEYTKSLEDGSRRMIEIQEEERRNLARELHDEIGQALIAVNLNLRTVKESTDPTLHSCLDESIRIVDDSVEQIRNLSLDLRPAMLDDLGLVSTLRWYADRQAQSAGFVLHFSAKTSAAPRSSHVITTCYRVAQQSLTNVVRHAHAKHVWVELWPTDHELHFIVRDDGLGFDTTKIRQRSLTGGRLGLMEMQKRVELLGGKFNVESQPGKGTTIRVSFPLSDSSNP